MPLPQKKVRVRSLKKRRYREAHWFKEDFQGLKQFEHF